MQSDKHSAIARRRVAITGIGMVTPLGLDTRSTWAALQAGKSGIAPISTFNARGFSTWIGAEVKGFDADQRIGDRKLLKLASRSHRFALAAAEDALADAGIRPDASTGPRWGCSVGAGMMGVSFEEVQTVHAFCGGEGEFRASGLVDEKFPADPVAFCRSQTNSGLALLTQRFGVRGYATSVHTACASGGQALGTALKVIRRGQADFMLAGGYDSMLNPVGLSGFCLLGALSTDNDTPERASRPFDATRNGFVLGEGAAFLVLEEWESARKRGAHIYAELAGDGNSLSSYRITDSPPSGDGPIQAMQQALDDAGLSADAVDYVNAHGTSTLMNDKSECAALKVVLGSHVAQAAVSSTKSCMGHLIAAAGAVEAAVCALAIRDGLAPVNANLSEPDPECDVNIVRGESRRMPIRGALSNSFGFGGSNSCLAFRHPDEVDAQMHGSGAGRRVTASSESPAAPAKADSRIVITGAGAVCGAGLSVEAIWEAVKSGRSAIAQIATWDTADWPASKAAEVNGVDNRTLVEDRKLHKLISRTDLFGLYAAGAAIRNSGLTGLRDAMAPEAAALFSDRCGVYAGSGGGNYRSNYDFFPLLSQSNGSLETFGRELGATVNPMWLLRNLPNNVLCHVGIRHTFKGANACITNQCVGGAAAVAEAAAGIRTDEADRSVAIGHDSPIEPETVLNYQRLGLLAGDTVRPFDEHRSGTLFGEGAAAVVLEREADARTRGATVLGHLLGAACVTEATGILDVRKDGDGVSRAIRMALAEAGIAPGHVGMIVAHGNGTRASDTSEAVAIRNVFGDNPPPVTAFKWAFGHLIAASGILDLVLALQALRERVVPGIATLTRLDPEMPALPVRAGSQAARSGIGLLVCRGFAGMNVALVVGVDGSA